MVAGERLIVIYVISMHFCKEYLTAAKSETLVLNVLTYGCTALIKYSMLESRQSGCDI